MRIRFLTWIWRSIARDEKLFDLLAQQADINRQAGVALQNFLNQDAAQEQSRKAIFDLDRHSDAVVEQIRARLGMRYVLPIVERKDFELLAKAQQAIATRIHRTAWTCIAVGFRSSEDHVPTAATAIKDGAAVAEAMLGFYRDLNFAEIRSCERSLDHLEGVVDAAVQSTLTRVFRDDRCEAKVVLRHRIVTERIERSFAACRHVGQLLVHLALKHGDFTHTMHARED